MDGDLKAAACGNGEVAEVVIEQGSAGRRSDSW